VVQDENCQKPDVSEAYSGPQCTGTFLEAPGLPGNYAANAEVVCVQQNFNAIVGNHLTILVQLRLTPKASEGRTSGSWKLKAVLTTMHRRLYGSSTR
jgi:hypothetical protein